MNKIQLLKIFKPNPFNAVSALVLPIVINIIFYKSDSFLRFLNFGINQYGYSLIGFLIQVVWIYIAVSLIWHFIILKVSNKTKTRWEQKKEFGNIWFEAIKFNLIAFIIFPLPLLLFTGINKLSLIFLIGPILSVFFCYLSLSNFKLGRVEFWWLYRLLPILGMILVQIIISILSIGVDLGLGGLVLLIYMVPFLHAYLVTEIFHFKNKQFKKN